jgi:uncharacterized protein (TIGR03118 family)
MFNSFRAWLRRARIATHHGTTNRHRAARRARCSLTLESLEERSLLSSGFYVQSNLVSDLPGVAANTDPALKNPWGISLASQGPFWLANNTSGTTTVYNGQGASLLSAITIPTATTGVPGTPTGTVFNTLTPNGFPISETVGGTTNTGSSVFLFVTQDGQIDGWSPSVDPAHAVVAVDNTTANPVPSYTGLAIGVDKAGQTLLYADDFKNFKIDVYNQNFQKVTNLQGNFQDPGLPAGYWPFNIQELAGKLYITYALPDPATGNGLHQAGAGIVDVYSNDGVLLTKHHLISNGPKSPLNAPWGVAIAPANFGQFSNDLLVGNFGDGRINAFNPNNGTFIGPLMLSNGQVFRAEDLWALQFGLGANNNGPTNTLFFTAGLNDQKDGLFGSLQAPPTVTRSAPVLPNLPTAVAQTFSTIPQNGDANPYGLAFVPAGYTGGGKLAVGDLLVSNFNSSSGTQGTGTTIQLITPDGQVSTFFQGQSPLGLTTALGVLKSGFVVVGNLPTDSQGNPQQGSLLIIDSRGNLVTQLTDSFLLDGPWDLAVNDKGTTAQVFVANVLNGTISRINLAIPRGADPVVLSETLIASGYTHRTDPAALVVGPTGLAFDPVSKMLFVASTGDNAIYQIAGALTSTGSQGKGTLIVQNDPHLHGPLGLVLAPNGDIIVSNGDAVSPGGTPNDLVEFTRKGKFVAHFQVDPGNVGAAFGLALSTDTGVLRFAVVNDNTNSVTICTLGQK